MYKHLTQPLLLIPLNNPVIIIIIKQVKIVQVVVDKLECNIIKILRPLL